MVKTKLKVGDSIKVIAGQWRGTLDHIHQIDRSKGLVYLQKCGLRTRFDRFAPENEKGQKTREIRKGLAVSNVAYYSPEHKEITKIGLQKSKGTKGKTSPEIKVRVSRKFKDKKGNNLLID